MQYEFGVDVDDRLYYLLDIVSDILLRHTTYSLQPFFQILVRAKTTP
jgi:hypothetical protein